MLELDFFVIGDCFIFRFKNWSIKYNKAEPIAPRYEINAPDMYIPGKIACCRRWNLVNKTSLQ